MLTIRPVPYHDIAIHGPRSGRVEDVPAADHEIVHLNLPTEMALWNAPIHLQARPAPRVAQGLGTSRGQTRDVELGGP
jgi:hypothetical protein